VIRWIGYDADEPERLNRMMDKNPQPSGKWKGKVIWDAPLVAWDMDRSDCEAIIKKSPLTFPGKSSCFFCPSMRKSEISSCRSGTPISCSARSRSKATPTCRP